MDWKEKTQQITTNRQHSGCGVCRWEGVHTWELGGGSRHWDRAGPDPLHTHWCPFCLLIKVKCTSLFWPWHYLMMMITVTMIMMMMAIMMMMMWRWGGGVGWWWWWWWWCEDEDENEEEEDDKDRRDGCWLIIRTGYHDLALFLMFNHCHHSGVKFKVKISCLQSDHHHHHYHQHSIIVLIIVVLGIISILCIHSEGQLLTVALPCRKWWWFVREIGLVVYLWRGLWRMMLLLRIHLRPSRSAASPMHRLCQTGKLRPTLYLSKNFPCQSPLPPSLPPVKVWILFSFIYFYSPNKSWTSPLSHIRVWTLVSLGIQRECGHFISINNNNIAQYDI